MNDEPTISIQRINWVTILSLLALITGIVFYIYWGIRYNIWVDIGIYSITIVFVLGGIIGIILSLLRKETT